MVNKRTGRHSVSVTMGNVLSISHYKDDKPSLMVKGPRISLEANKESEGLPRNSKRTGMELVPMGK